MPGREPAGVGESLELALEAEASERWIESYALCERALEESPEEPGALNLLGRLCARAGDLAKALALQSFVLHLVPGHARAAADLASAQRAIRSPAEGRRAYERAIAIEPDLACHHRHPLSLTGFVGMDEAERWLRESIGADPSRPEAHAALGNLSIRRSDRIGALNAYGIAAMLRWEFAAAHVALADLLDAIPEEAMARRHRLEAVRFQTVYAAGAASNAAVRRVLVLATTGGAIENAPLDLVVNPARTALHRWYLAGADPGELPPYDVIFNGIEEMESSAGAIALASEVAAKATVPVINDPKRLVRLRRSRLRESLAGVEGCVVPQAIRASRAQLESADPAAAELLGIAFPVVVRPVDRHRGEGCERLAHAGELAAYLGRHRSEHYNVAPFVEYRSDDGYYRKYRIAVVDGRPFPYHLAISEAWMVHYLGSPTAERGWMRREEEAFLADPGSVFERWEQPFAAIAQALGMEYFGVDCARLADGSVLVFECGTAMLIHCLDGAEALAYKYRYVPRIFDAVERMLDARIAASGAP